MLRYQHSDLFEKGGRSVQKTYRIPRFLDECISSFSSENNLTNTDVIIDALLHYFSERIAGSFSEALSRNSLDIEAARKDRNLNEVKRLTFEQRRLELMRTEFVEYYEDATERLLAGLREKGRRTPGERGRKCENTLKSRA